MKWKLLLSLLLFVFLSASVTAQFADQSSDYKYYYRLNADDVKGLLKSDNPQIELSHLHTFIDSIAVDSVWMMQEFGSFLEVYFEQNILIANILSNVPFEVAVLDNQTDLAISVTDATSETIRKAKVHINNKRIGYDNTCECYRIRKSNKEGLLSVKVGNEAVILPISRKSNYSKFKRFKNGLLYRSPLKYAVLPVRYIVNLPIDGYKSIKEGYSRGSIRGTTNFFERLYRRVACKFDDWYCDEDYDFNDKIDGYMVFSKPKYRTNDTLKVKAFITYKQKRAWKKPVILELTTRYGGTAYYKDTLAMDKAGVVHHSIPILESLRLTLDQEYRIVISDLKDRTLMSGSFKYEDYELSGINLKVEGASETHYRGVPMELKLTGTDENELPLYDARYQVIGQLVNIHTCPDSMTVLRDTLFDISKTNNEEGINVKIPDSVFQDCQIDYQLTVKMRTADNDKLEESHQIKYSYDNKKVTGQIKDSLLVLHLENDGKRITDVPMSISFYRYGRFIKQKEITLPWVWDEPYLYDHVHLTDDSGRRFDLGLSTIDPGVQVNGERTLDSVHVMISNPLKIPVHYFLYRSNQEIDAGRGINLNLHKRDISQATYSLMMTYVWASNEVHKPYSLVHNSKQLSLKIDQSPTIYPGKTDTIKVSVVDGANNPVKGIDVTAFGLTDKFDYSLPSIPLANGPQVKKKYYNQFESDRSEVSIQQEVDYWQRKAFPELNEKDYYDLIFPGTKLYKKEFAQKDSITQFAPFVVDRGELKYCNVIYVDDRPVYFAWNTIPTEYSFKVSPGMHNIRIRTDNAEIRIDKVEFKKGVKTIMSVDQAFSHKKISVIPKEPKLTDAEKVNLYPYIFPFTLPGSASYLASLYTSGRYFVLENKNNTSHRTSFTGPVRQSYYTMRDHDRDFVIKDIHVPLYVYEFRKSRLKMTTLKDYKYPRFVNQTLPWDYDDEVLTIRTLDSLERVMSREVQREKSFYVPRSTNKGRGKIQLLNPSHLPILHVFLLNDNDYSDIGLYGGTDRVLHDIPPGEVSLLVIYDDQHYIEYRQIKIHADAIHVINLEEFERKYDEERFDQFNRLLENYSNTKDSDLKASKELINGIRREIKPISIDNDEFGRTVEGVITDDAGEPLIGATVILKGTSIGTATDIDGSYSLDVPGNDYQTLVVSYTGFTDMEIEFGPSNRIDVALSEGLDLDEVVVTGLGIKKELKALGYGVVEITSDNMSNVLQGRATGVTIQQASGVAGAGAQILIRGNNSIKENTDPLLVIDGVVYKRKLENLDPELITNIGIIKDEAAVAIYGSSARNGVIIITTTESIPLTDVSPISSLIDLPTVPQDVQYSIRSNFRDDAFWQPSLTTDKNGEATFVVQYPDDVTKWNTYAIAMDERLRSGTAQAKVRSFKPLLAELKLPRFLTAGDQAQAIGNVSNYTGDSVEIRTTFSQYAEELITAGITLNESYIDTLLINPPSNQDSITFEYTLDDGKGYIDGEIRDVMIQPLGFEKSIGEYYYLSGDMDTTLNVTVVDSLDDAILWVDNTSNSSLIQHLEYLEDYKYGCNEQLSSRLIGHLVRAEVCNANKKPCRNQKRIRKLIKELVNNQNESGLWSWYGNNKSTAPWSTNHVMRALSMARSLGYEVNLSEQSFREGVLLDFDKSKLLTDRLHLTDAAMLHGDTLLAITLAKDLRFNELSSYRDSMQYAQVVSDIRDTATAYLLQPYLKESGLGNLYFSCKSGRWGGYLDASYIFGYAAMKSSDSFSQQDVQQVQNHFYKTKSGRWFNTYTSALWLYYNWRDLLESTEDVEEVIIKNGMEEIIVQSFPYIDTIDVDVQIVKNPGLDLYISTNQSHWDAAPEELEGFFNIKTTLNQYGEEVTALKTGDEAQLKVRFEVSGTADHVVLRIPIPASCSYASKPTYFRHAVHAEYFREEVAIFYKNLPDGVYDIRIPLLPRFGGIYHINPAQAYMMYNPDNQGNTEVKVVEVE